MSAADRRTAQGLHVLERIPEGLLDLDARELHTRLPGPTLIHLPGRRERPLFVSVLLHGNETSGWDAVREVLAAYADRELPRALSLFIGNIEAARIGRRHLDHQIDFNRAWNDGATPEHATMAAVVAEMQQRDVELSIDIHNNTGNNPHYGCVNSTDPRYLQLARLFSRLIVYFRQPDSVQSMAFAALCPAVTVECGRADAHSGADHAAEFVRAVLNLSELPSHPIAPHDIDVFHTVATLKVPPDCRFTYGEAACDLRFEAALDRLNFAEVAAGTPIATVHSSFDGPLVVTNEAGNIVTDEYFEVTDGTVRFRRAMIPAMITLDEEVIRQDCVCYLMERYPWQQASGADEQEMMV
ncbi:MAG: M14 family metallopeptidase [Gammaproteobacteria bacterium]